MKLFSMDLIRSQDASAAVATKGVNLVKYFGVPLFRRAGGLMRGCLLLAISFLLAGSSAFAGGTWVPLANQAPDNIDTALLLTDGTVIATAGEANGGGNIGSGWYKLTPDSTGSYVNGTWTILSPMHDSRLYFSTDILKDGRLLVAGAEYGSGWGTSEVYDPLTDTWTSIPVAAGLLNLDNNPDPFTGENSAGFMDSASKILPNGNVLVTPVFPANCGQCLIYDVSLNTWVAGPTYVRGCYQDEASLVKLPDDSILTIDPFGTNSERYIPSLNKWVDDATVPVPMYDVNGEIGAAFMLANGQAFFLGASGNSALYTPSGTIAPGAWTAGPVIPDGQGAPDSPAAMMVNGKILLVTAVINTFDPPARFYEYDPVTNGFASVAGPLGTFYPTPSFVNRMLDLPDGNVLLSSSSPQLYVYQPDGTPLDAGKPNILSVAPNGDGSFHLTGTLLNGISEGAAYGDDVQENSNYPIVRMTNSTGGVFYARTFNWSSTSVMTSNQVLSTDFTLPPGLPAGTYSLVTVANGNSSDPVIFNASSGPNLSVLTNYVIGGNGNGLIDNDECNQFDIVLANAGTSAATGVRATLFCGTPGVTIVQKNSTYPNMPVGASGTNQTHFKVSTSPNFACGTPIHFTLVVSSAQNTISDQLIIPTGNGAGAVIRFNNNNVVNIPDGNLRGTNSTIVVSNVFATLQNVAVSMNIIHPSVSELALELIGPDGTHVLLTGGSGLSGANFGFDCADGDRTAFDDNGFFPINFASSPYVGTFLPNQPLVAFAGKSGAEVNGTWKLNVVDQASGNVGAIECWSLNLTPTGCIDGGGTCPGVDLALSMSPFPNPALVGASLTYTMVVINNGPDVAHSVSLTQTLPSGVTFVSASATQGSASNAGGTVNCNLGTLAIGAAATVTVVVTPTSAGTLFSTASVGSADTDIDPSNNSVTISTVVNPPSSDLAIGLTATPNPILVGGVLIYTVSVTNNGPSTASNVIVSNTLPASVGILSASSTQGSQVNNGNTIVCSLGSMAKGAKAVITISAFPTVVGAITATAAVSSGMLDPLPGNNIASVTTSVTPAADVSLSMVSVPTSVIRGSNVSYLILVSNHGPSPAPNVSISDTLPAGVTFVSATNSAGASFTHVGQAVTLTVTNLDVNASALFTITVNTGSITNAVPLFITNSASVSSSAADPNLPNNLAFASTRVDSARPTIIAAGARLLSESIQPTNGFIDPGETVTVLLNLENIGNISTVNLVASLQAGGGVNLTAGPQAQSYGALAVGGGPVAHAFTFTAATNVSAVTATLNLQDGATNLGSVQFTFPYPTVTSFANITNIIIPDHGPATPAYPSTITVSGVTGLIDKVTVTMTNVNHTFPDDIDMLLVGPSGQTTLLMSHCGDGGAMTNVSLTFDDGAASFLTISGQIISGAYKPTQNGSVAFPATNTPAGPYGSALTSFNGTNANGIWSLYVFDSSPGDQGIIIGGWSLGITAGTPVNQVVDLAVTGTASPNPVLAGNNLTYTFSITNNGPNTANALAFTNVLPTGLNFVSATSSQGNCSTDPNGAIYCLITNLPVGINVTVSIVAMPTIPGTLTNRATITSVDTDLNQFNNTGIVISTVTAPVADLSVAMSAAPNPIAIGGSVIYTVTVTNIGPGAALGVAASVPLANLNFVSGIGFSNVSGTAFCQIGTLSAGSGVALSFVAVPTQLGTVSSTVTASTFSSDPNLVNNSASTAVTVVTPSPSILVSAVTLTSESFLPANGAIDPGETVNILFHLANVGTADTTNLVVTLLATNGITPLSGAINNGVLVHGGAAVLDGFSFSVATTNTGSVNVLLQLQDGGASLGTISYPFILPATNSFANTGVIVIPDSGAATPYPSAINISGLSGVVSKATVTLSNLNHAFPNDIEILLVSPSGAKTVLMSGAGGGFSIRNATLTLDDAAGSSLPASAQIVTGTYKPTENSLIAPFPSPAPTGTYSASMATFNGTTPNGAWLLYVFDNSPGDSGNIVGGWSLSLNTVTPVDGSSDLTLAVSGPSGPVAKGSYLTYNIAVTNNGPDIATGVAFYDTFPAGWSVTGSVPPYYGIVGNRVQYDLGKMVAGGSTNISITFLAPSGGQYSNVFIVSAIQFDINPGDNSSTVVANITTPVVLSTFAYGPGSTFNFTLTGLPNTSYVILASPDLSTWTPVGTNVTSGAGTFLFHDINAGSFPRRYYRAQVGP